MRIVKNAAIDKEKWNTLLVESNYSSSFQTLEFYNLYNSISNFSAEIFATEKDGKYKSLIVVTIQKEKRIKGFFSKRGIIYGGPLILDTDHCLDELLECVKDHYTNKLIFLEIRNHHDFSTHSNHFLKNSFNYIPHLNVQLKLDSIDIDSVISKMKYNRRREIKQSYSEGAVSREANSEDEIKDLYKILKDLYENRVKLPLYSYSFFLNLFRSDIGKVFVVIHNQEVIGGSFCIYHKEMAINTLYYAGLRNYHKKIFPTHLAVIEVIKFAINNNLPMVDFMGAGKPDEDYGVRKYKLQFGGELVSHGRYRLVLNAFLYKLGEFGLKILSKF